MDHSACLSFTAEERRLIEAQWAAVKLAEIREYQRKYEVLASRVRQLEDFLHLDGEHLSTLTSR